MTATAVAVAVDYAPPPPRQGIAALRARHARPSGCAWLRAALDPDVRSASIAMTVLVAMNGDKASNPFNRTFEVREIACPTCHPIPSPCGKRRRTDGEPLFRSGGVVKDCPLGRPRSGSKILYNSGASEPLRPSDRRRGGTSRALNISGQECIGTVTI